MSKIRLVSKSIAAQSTQTSYGRVNKGLFEALVKAKKAAQAVEVTVVSKTELLRTQTAVHWFAKQSRLGKVGTRSCKVSNGTTARKLFVWWR